MDYYILNLGKIALFYKIWIADLLMPSLLSTLIAQILRINAVAK